MNSSGIKRGLAATAVGALAVTGIPFLASSAHAAPGDNFTVTYTGPALNGGDQGAVVVLRAENGEIDESLLDLTSTSSAAAGSEDTDSQTADIVDASIVDDPSNAAFDLITLNIAVTTPDAGQTATFRVFEDDTDNDSLDASEARATVSLTTSGPLAKVEVAPASQSAPQGQDSGDYTVTLKDAAGRTTQLRSTETVEVDSDADVTLSDTSLDADELERGTATFTASGATVGDHTITLDASAPAAVPNATAKLVVTESADITADEVDVVTNADSWDGFDGGTDGGTTYVRVDQSSIRIDFDGDATDKNSTVSMTVTGAGVTFGGKPSTTVTTVLDADGKGSVTITPDAGTVQEGDSITVSGNGFDQTFEFERAYVADVVSADRYISALKGSVNVTATVLDQFGLPVTTGFVEAYRTEMNADATHQRKAVGADGKVTFTFTDAKAVAGDVETVMFDYFPDQFAADPTRSGSTEIKYTVDGKGADFKTMLDGVDTEGATYKASDVSVDPLSDTVVSAFDDESIALLVDAGEPNSEVTVSVDNGALILAAGEDELSEGSASVTATLDGNGDLAGYQIIGTKSGVTTVTVSAAGRTETAQFTVAPQTDLEAARNVSVSGPATVLAGTTQITYTAVVTDAFGNPIAGFPRELINPVLNVTVTGPGQFQDGETQTNANGEIKLNVKLDPNAEGPVTITVVGEPTSAFFGETQFGAAEDRLTADSNTDDGKGLSASSNVASATTTVLPKDEVQEPINLNAGGKNNGKKADKLKVTADDNAAGLVAKVFVKGKKVASHTLNASGDWNFTIKDKNGKKATKYTVKVAASETTLGESASKSIK